MKEFTSQVIKSIVMTGIVIALIYFWLFTIDFFTNAHAGISDKEAVTCLMGEARGEEYKTIVATAEALRNRGTTKGVYGCSFSGDEPQWVWHKVAKAWQESKYTNYVDGATHWESTDFDDPYWSISMTMISHIGKHKFYREDKK